MQFFPQLPNSHPQCPRCRFGQTLVGFEDNTQCRKLCPEYFGSRQSCRSAESCRCTHNAPPGSANNERRACCAPGHLAGEDSRNQSSMPPAILALGHVFRPAKSCRDFLQCSTTARASLGRKSMGAPGQTPKSIAKDARSALIGRDRTRRKVSAFRCHRGTCRCPGLFGGGVLSVRRRDDVAKEV